MVDLNGDVVTDGMVNTKDAAFRVLFEGRAHAHRAGSGRAFAVG